jgi:hypothetical protein
VLESRTRRRTIEDLDIPPGSEERQGAADECGRRFADHGHPQSTARSLQRVLEGARGAAGADPPLPVSFDELGTRLYERQTLFNERFEGFVPRHRDAKHELNNEEDR